MAHGFEKRLGVWLVIKTSLEQSCSQCQEFWLSCGGVLGEANQMNQVMLTVPGQQGSG